MLVECATKTFYGADRSHDGSQKLLKCRFAGPAATTAAPTIEITNRRAPILATLAMWCCDKPRAMDDGHAPSLEHGQGQ
jgi:hypothetical protein